MMWALTSFVLSLATFFGGHFYNGRWARATLFAALLLAVLALAGLVALCGFTRFCSAGYVDYYDFQEWIRRLKVLVGVTVAAVGAVWLASALTAAFDGRKGPIEEAAESSMARVLAVVAMCGFGVVVLAAIPFLWYVGPKLTRPQEEETRSGPAWPVSRSPRRAPSQPMTVTEAPPLPPAPAPVGGEVLVPGPLSFGLTSGLWGVLGPGRGFLQGEVRANGKPVSGLKLRLVAELGSLTEWGTSNADGYYSIAVPPGQYKLRGWEIDADSASKTIAGKIVNPATSRNLPPHFLTVTTDTATSALDLEFIDPIVRVRPANGEAITSATVFEWKPYPGATYYRMYMQSFGTTPDGEPRDVFVLWHPSLMGTTTTAVAAGFMLRSGHYYTWKLRAYNTKETCISETANDIALFRMK
jgi:hypothetical protein